MRTLCRFMELIQISVISVYVHHAKLRTITWDRIVPEVATDEEC